MGLFERHGDAYLPTELSRGPWRDDALHGGPVAGLIVRAAELHPDAAGTAVARATIELCRAALFAPLTPRVQVVRSGRLIRVLRVELYDSRGLVTLAHVLTMVDEPIAVPDQFAPVPPVDTPEDGSSDLFTDRDGTVRFHSHAVEGRLTEGKFEAVGRTSAWFRLRTELVEGEPTTPAQRAAVVSDLAAIGCSLSATDYIYPNGDISLHLLREPAGEWLRISSSQEVGPRGVGMTDATLSDRIGRVGRIARTEIVQRRPG